MAEPDAAVVRKNLSEGLYIMLDENLGGGVSLQKNIEQLPAEMRPRILEARRAFERDVLFTPVLAALEEGNELQVAGGARGLRRLVLQGTVLRPAARGDDRRRQRPGVRFSVSSPNVRCSSRFSRRLLTPVARRVAAQAFSSPLLPGAGARRKTPASRWPCWNGFGRDPEVREAARALVSTSLDPEGPRATRGGSHCCKLRSRAARRPRGRACRRSEGTTGWPRVPRSWRPSAS